MSCFSSSSWFPDFAQYVRDSSGPSTSTVLNAMSAHPRYKPTTTYIILILNQSRCYNFFSFVFSCVSRTAENGSTAQHVGNVWNHVRECVQCKLIQGYHTSSLTTCINVCIYLNFCPLSLETLPVLWPLCPARPPMRASSRKGGLLQLWQPDAQTQSLPSQRHTQGQQVSSENGPCDGLNLFRFNICTT